jgi:signal transduction histidine kinase
MPASISPGPDHADAIETERADGEMVAAMRVVLALSIMLAVYVDPAGLYTFRGFASVVFATFAVYSLVLYCGTKVNLPLTHTRLIHWLDIVWFGLLVAITGGVDSMLFLLFFLAILPASFRWGASEGTQITIASAIVFVTICLMPRTGVEPSRLLLRTTLLLGLGYMMAHWGAAKLDMKQQLALLRDVSRLSNPRFGVEFGIGRVMHEIRAYFGGASCVVILRDRDTGEYLLRIAAASEPMRQRQVDDEAAAPLLAYPTGTTVLFRGAGHGWLLHPQTCLLYRRELGKWIHDEQDTCKRIADLLDARAFISAPLDLSRYRGRIYVTATHWGLSKAEAMFLHHAAHQAFLALDNTALLDQLASGAAFREREKIALDLHDSTIQPYVGLRLGLMALRKRASADNPLLADIEELLNIAGATIDELRSYAGTLRQKLGGAVDLPSTEVLRQQADRAAQLYGIAIEFDADAGLRFNDRVMAEVVQIMREGLSNMARHARATEGAIALRVEHGHLQIVMQNPTPVEVVPFTPKSIARRACALGGRVQVDCVPHAWTSIRVDIPL